MTVAMVGLIVVIVALLVERAVTARQYQQERERWQEACATAHRTAINASLSRTGTDFARAEVVSRNGTPSPEPRKVEPVPEGLG